MDNGGNTSQVDPPSLVDATEEWLEYAAEPSGARLFRLLGVFSSNRRNELIRAVEDLFYRQEAWRVAQHAAMLHLDRFEPYVGVTDLVRALNFAHHACSISQNDPRARIAMGWVNWARRLAFAVYYDVEQVHSEAERLREELAPPLLERIRGEAFLLEGLARAYMGELPRALECLREAESRKTLTLEALAQLLVGSESNAPDAAYWAAQRLPEDVELGGRLEARRLRVWRRRLAEILRTRGDK